MPAPTKAPEPKVPIAKVPAPRASSTGSAVTSGATSQGSGTGAGGTGNGPGAGRTGTGQGGGAVTKAQHISGQIDNARDFPVPPGGREARVGKAVILALVTLATATLFVDVWVAHPAVMLLFLVAISIGF